MVRGYPLITSSAHSRYRSLRMALTTKVSGMSRITSATALVYKCGLMDPSMKDFGRTISETVKVDSSTQTETCMRATGEGTKLMARDSTSTSMDQHTKVSGAITNNMVMVSRHCLMAQYMKVNICLERSMVPAHYGGLTTANTRVSSETM